MIIEFPYPKTKTMQIPDDLRVTRFSVPQAESGGDETEIVRRSLANPIGTATLTRLAQGKQRVLIVADDVSRPTPIHRFAPLVLEELAEAGVPEANIEFMIALGTHRPMTGKEMETKLGATIVNRFPVYNHDWQDESTLEFLGTTDQGAPVWINKRVRQADLVIGLGAIMPIEICGFTGGGKILVPGLSGAQTVDFMHWTRIDVPGRLILGKIENPIRTSIDALARKAGLDFIVNVILSGNNRIIGAVAGDMVEAHRVGCRTAKGVFGVEVPRKFNIVITDSYPFDNEFWQANKALDTAGEVVSRGGVIILVSPCREGLSQTHGEEIRRFGYPPLARIKELVESGKIEHRVVGVHMAQVGAVVTEKARLILVSGGIRKEEAEALGFFWAANPPEALDMALEMTEEQADIAVLRGASRMIAMPPG
jgi:nickel-dependent lactate racemase